MEFHPLIHPLKDGAIIMSGHDTGSEYVLVKFLFVLKRAARKTDFPSATFRVGVQEGGREK